MVFSRYDSPPAIIYTPRISLEGSQHAVVDTALKDLKNLSRRLQKAIILHRDELRVLDRLHYKGRNQHRSALFWGRAVEIKRYGARLSGMSIQELVEDLRCSFFGQDARSNPKLLKGAWTSIPQEAYLKFIRNRLSACSALMVKTNDRLLNAQSHFTLVTRTGAFLHLLVTLTAITSRIAAVIQEISNAVQCTHEVCQRLLQAFKTTPPKAALNIEILSQLSERSTVETMPATPDNQDIISMSVQSDDIPLPDLTDNSVKRLSTRKVTTSPPTASVGEKAPSAPIKLKQKKKKKRDAIDEIFGF